MTSPGGDPRRYLLDRGHDADGVDRATAEGTLPLLVAEEMILPGERDELTATEVVAAAAVDEDIAHRLWRALGFPEAGEDERLFTAADVAALRAAGSLIDLRVDADGVIEMTRVLGSATSRVAEALTDLVVARAEAAFDDGADIVTLADDVLREMPIETFMELNDYVMRRQLVATLRRRLQPDTAFEGDAEAGLAVGFADLAGFTELSNAIDDERLAEVISRFDSTSRDLVADGRGRVVKTIGDEIMFVADDLADAGRIALGLVDAFADDDVLPAVRVGLDAGPVMSRGGDYFGPHVNKASRLTGYAYPGTVLVSQEIHDALSDDDAWDWRSLGRVGLKDLGPTRVWVMRRHPS